MKGKKQVIDVLSQVLRKELTGINQYYLHAKMCENWGYKRLRKILPMSPPMTKSRSDRP
jgi:bacterioferritin (cytochrome b1)